MCRAIIITAFAAVFLDTLATAQQQITAAAATVEGAPMVALPLEFPVVVMWYNPTAPAEACSAVEVQFVDDQIASTLNLGLTNDGMESIAWESSLSLLNAKKYDIHNSLHNDREIVETECDMCLYDMSLIKSLCNAIHNCADADGANRRRNLRNQNRGRRYLRTAAAAAAAVTTDTAVDMEEVALQLTAACHAELETLSINALLASTCQEALANAVCRTEFLQ